MNTGMGIKRVFCFGALVGASLAALFMFMDWIRPFPVPANVWVERTLFRICPFYALGFSNLVHSMTALIAMSLIGNALLYGVAALIIVLPYWVFRRATKPIA